MDARLRGANSEDREICGIQVLSTYQRKVKI